MVQVSEAELEALVAKGYLAPSERNEVKAAQEAVEAFLSDVLSDA